MTRKKSIHQRGMPADLNRQRHTPLLLNRHHISFHLTWTPFTDFLLRVKSFDNNNQMIRNKNYWLISIWINSKWKTNRHVRLEREKRRSYNVPKSQKQWCPYRLHALTLTLLNTCCFLSPVTPKTSIVLHCITAAMKY